MNITKKLIALLLAACMLLGMAGCNTDAPATTTAAPTTEPPVDVGALYTDAAAGLEAAGKLSVEIDDVRTITVGEQTFDVETELTLNYAKDAAGRLTADVSQDTDYGSYDLEAEEVFLDGKVYAVVNDIPYLEEMTDDEYAARFVPAVMIDPALYNTSSVSEDGTTLTFREPSAVESWLGAGENAQALSGTATVTLDAQGAVVSTVYEVTYREGATTVNRKITARICPASDKAVEVPDDAGEYRQIDYLDTVYTLEEAFGLMVQAKAVTAASSKTTISEALAISRVEQEEVDYYPDSQEQMIRAEQTLTQTSYATGETASDSIEEVFRDGKYSYSSNGEPWSEDSAVTYELMRNHYQTLLLANFWDANCFEGVTVTEVEGLTLYEFDCGEFFDSTIRAEINYEFFEDETYLDNLADAYSAGESNYYIAVDSASKLPTAIGLTYSGYHTIYGEEYLLSQEVSHSFDLASLSAYENITGETAPEEEPAEKATPLFYKVTGSDGQVMWLLGTIHLGDSRTAYLPEEIMDAFNESNSLAVESDVIALEERLETDQQLITALAGSYYFMDGTTTADHIEDKELAAKAELLLKVSGNYNSTMLLMKAALWKETLESFYARQGYLLTSEKGVDMRLLKLAKEQNKTIIDIENATDSLLMPALWSEQLQEMLLQGTVETGMQAYNAQLLELYNMWCSGDEAALTEYIQSEGDDVTDEERPYYDEYVKSMSTDRNALMLEAAKTYLESGETVFYAVGLAHLLAEDGLVNTLKAAGYTVEPVSFE